MKLSKDGFKEREHGLENAFFFEMDQQLIQRLKEKAETEKGRAVLAEVTGISDGSLLNELLDVGISAECLVALSLVPLIQVAWADWGMNSQERDAILQAAAQKGIDDTSASYQLLNEWLTHKPDDKLFSTWRHYIAAIAERISPEQLQKLQQDVMQRTRHVAEAAGGFLNFAPISAAEKTVLNEIADAFAVEE